MHDLHLFFIASLLLNLTPGNDMIYVASRSLSQGVRAGIVSSLGIFIGCLFHVIAAIAGLSFVLANSVVLFMIIKTAGAAYLIYLGLRAVFSKREDV